MGGICGKKKPKETKDSQEEKSGPVQDVALAAKDKPSNTVSTGSASAKKGGGNVATLDAPNTDEDPATTGRKGRLKRDELPPSENPYIETKIIYVGFPTTRRRWRRRRMIRNYEEVMLRGSLNDRAIHYSSNLVERHVRFANKAVCGRSLPMRDCC